MRKRNVKFLADIIFWYLLYFLPVICYLLYLFAEPACGTQIVDLGTFFDNIGIVLVQDNVVSVSLRSIFGVDGILPFFATDFAIDIFSWFICVYITHLAVDFLLFIPRLAHKYMDKFTQGD